MQQASERIKHGHLSHHKPESSGWTHRVNSMLKPTLCEGCRLSHRFSSVLSRYFEGRHDNWCYHTTTPAIGL